MMGRIEKTVFIGYRRESSPSTRQANFSSPQNRNRPHTIREAPLWGSPRERDNPSRRSIISIRTRFP